MSDEPTCLRCGGTPAPVPVVVDLWELYDHANQHVRTPSLVLDGLDVCRRCADRLVPVLRRFFSGELAG